MTAAEPFQSASWYRVAELVLRLKSHGQIQHHRYRGHSWYVLHDPASGRVHRFTPAAYAFIRAMDGRKTIDTLWTAMASALEANAPTQDEIIRLLSQLYEADLLHLDRLPNAEAFLHLLGRQRRSFLMNTVRNPISITVPLWDPDAFLGRTVGPFRPLLGWGGMLLWALVVLPAVVLGVLHYRELTENISDRLLSAEGLLLIALVFPVVKAAHELGHAYALKALGGEVHQIGLMFIAFYPVPYVDASAAAILPYKGQRILIGAAGMLVELVMAALAMYVWLTIEPGLVRSVAFDIIVVASVSTLIVNGNPLLRFDGYFILSDLIEIPNLAQRTSRWWGRLVQRLLFGLQRLDSDNSTRGERAWFLFYGPMSFAYRMFVLLSLSLFIASEYFVIGVMFALMALANAVLMPLGRGVARTLNIAQLQASSRQTKVRLAAGTATLAGLALLLPLPMHTNAEGVVWLPEDAYVRAGADGFVEHVHMSSGALVARGVPLVGTVDVFLGTQIALNRLRIQELETRLVSERFANRVLAEITTADLAEERARLASNEEKQANLTATSGRSGTFFLAKQTDVPGRFYRKGDTIGYILPEHTRTLRTIVLQDNIDLVRQTLLSTRVRPSFEFGTVMPARIIREVPAAGDEVPSAAFTLRGGGQIASNPDDPKGLKVSRRIFQFDLELDRPVPQSLVGSRVYVRFQHYPEPIAHQLYRRIRQLFLARFYA